MRSCAASASNCAASGLTLGASRAMGGGALPPCSAVGVDEFMGRFGVGSDALQKALCVPLQFVREGGARCIRLRRHEHGADRLAGFDACARVRDVVADG